jgi:nitrate/TMAO reductase-like tetraheme cytochrome c subunit
LSERFCISCGSHSMKIRPAEKLRAEYILISPQTSGIDERSVSTMQKLTLLSGNAIGFVKFGNKHRWVSPSRSTRSSQFYKCCVLCHIEKNPYGYPCGDFRLYD